MSANGSATGLELHCDQCGKEYTHPKRLANHAMHCTGAVATRGRIDRLAHRPEDPPAPIHADRTPPRDQGAARRSREEEAELARAA